MTPDIQSLRDKAKAALECEASDDMDLTGIMQFAAAVTPETILSLIEALEKAEANALEEAAVWFIETFKTEARFYPNEVAAYLRTIPAPIAERAGEIA